LLKRSRGRLPSRAEEGDGADTWGRAVSGCGREEGAAAGLAAVLGRTARTAGLAAVLGHAARKGEASWAGRRKACGPKSRRGGEENDSFLFFFFYNFPNPFLNSNFNSF